MLGRDENSNPTEYRTWIVNNAPDFDGYLYTGLKSGNNPLIDITAYALDDGYTVADFNFPVATDWSITHKVLPTTISSSQLAVIDGYAYLFGSNLSSKIYRANLNNPADWEDTGANLPFPLHSSQFAIINDFAYLFGGHDGYTSTDHVFIAPISDPLSWRDLGAILPKKLHSSQLGIIDGYVYLFGGNQDNLQTNVILKANTSLPTSWIDTGSTLPVPLSNSHIGIIDGYSYLFGGLTTSNAPSNIIYYSSNTDPTTWFTGSTLPFAISNGQFFTIGNRGYLTGPVSPSPAKASYNKILRCNLTNPNLWIDTGKTIPGEISQSQFAIIYDRMFLFGGNGSTTIFAGNPLIKYDFNPFVISYGAVTRTAYQATIDPLDLFKVLGFPQWKTNYSR